MLTDRDAFERAIDLSARWLATTARTDFPDAAFSGTSFEIPESSPVATGSVVRTDDEQGAVWAARLEFLGDRVPGRSWVSDLFVERRQGGLTRFGAQLVCEASVADPGFDHSRPRLVREILANLSAEADGDALQESVTPIDVGEVSDFVSLMYRANRRLPIVLVSTDDDGGAQINLDQLAKRLSGTAHLRSIGIDAAFELTELVGKRMSAFNGAARIYMPGLETETQDPFQHPLFLPPQSGRNPKLLGALCDRILPMGFLDPDGEARFWRVGLLRQVTSRAAATEAKGSKEEQLEAEIRAFKDEAEELRETALTAEALMEEANTKLLSAEAEVARLNEQIAGLRSNLQKKLQSDGAPLSSLTESDIYSLHDQSPTLETSLKVLMHLFSDRVVILDTAIASARDSSSFRFGKRAFELLWTLCTSYWRALSEGEGDSTARRFFGNSYAAKEAESLSESGKRRRVFTYGNEPLEMMKHLKIGVKDSKSETLRVHFEWVSEKRLIVIGHCGGHLDF